MSLLACSPAAVPMSEPDAQRFRLKPVYTFHVRLGCPTASIASDWLRNTKDTAAPANPHRST